MTSVEKNLQSTLFKKSCSTDASNKHFLYFNISNFQHPPPLAIYIVISNKLLFETPCHPNGKEVGMSSAFSCSYIRSLSPLKQLQVT